MTPQAPYQVQAQQPTYQQPGQPMAQPPSNKGKKTAAVILVVVVVAIVLLAILLMGFSGSDESEENFPEGYSIKMSDTDTMKVHYKGEYSGETASGMRDVIDRFYGDDDGTVTSNEVNDLIAQAESLEGDYSTNFLIDGEEGVYSKSTLSLKGATGDVDSEDPISVTWSYTIDWDYIDSDEYSYDIEIYVFPEQEESFEFSCPPGYEIDEIDNLEDESYNNGRTKVKGTVSHDVIVYITIVEIGGTEPTPTGALAASEDVNVPGKYYVTFIGSVKNDKIQIQIIDDSLGYSDILSPDTDSFIQIPGGINMTYTDANANDKLDAADIIVIEGGESGDTIRVIYEPTGEIITELYIT